MKDLSPGLPLAALHPLNNSKQPLTSGPATEGNHGNLSCPAEEKNKIPGVVLSHLGPSNSFHYNSHCERFASILLGLLNVSRPCETDGSLGNLRHRSGPDPAAQRLTAIVNVEMRTPAAFHTSFKAHPFTLSTSKVYVTT